MLIYVYKLRSEVNQKEKVLTIEYGTQYKRSEKNIKKHYNEQNTLNKIKNHIKICNSFTDLKNNPISKIYGYESLKHDLSGYYSFNLCKNGGKIRLIFSVNESKNEIILEYISVNHYTDFKNKL